MKIMMEFSYPLKSAIYPLKWTIYPLKWTIYRIKWTIYQLKQLTLYYIFRILIQGNSPNEFGFY